MIAVAAGECLALADFHDARRKLISNHYRPIGGTQGGKTAEMRSVGVQQKEKEGKIEKENRKEPAL